MSLALCDNDKLVPDASDHRIGGTPACPYQGENPPPAERPKDPPGLVTVIHGIAFDDKRPEAGVMKGFNDVRGIEPCNSVARYLPIQSNSGPHRDGRGRRAGGLGKRDPASRDARHLHKSGLWSLQVMKTVMDEHKIESVVCEWQAFDVRNNRHDVEAIAARSLPCSPRRAERKIARYNACPCPREELRVHPGTAAYG